MLFACFFLLIAVNNYVTVTDFLFPSCILEPKLKYNVLRLVVKSLFLLLFVTILAISINRFICPLGMNYLLSTVLLIHSVG